MVSKNEIKLISSLGQKKYREKTGLFVAEGFKAIHEFIKAKYKIHSFFVVENTAKVDIMSTDFTLISEAELKKISFLKNPNMALAIFEIPKAFNTDSEALKVVLDGVQDPGNLGTIIRLCDWFGITSLICSKDTVDCYNPKVVQATMGSLARVTVCYNDLANYLTKCRLPIYGGFMEGDNVYSSKLEKNAILVLGNEGKGISTAIEKHITHKITIPQFGDLQSTESLNVATATAILLSEFKRPIEK